MKDALVNFIKEKNLFKLSDKLLVAVSGGADSVALCHLLKGINASFIIAHCNFQLRAAESEADEDFVKSLAKELGVKVYVNQFNTSEIAKNKGQSIQMIARTLRYGWFEQLRHETNSKYIVTAHHKSDNVETILLNLTRGTGIAGLHGIKAKSGPILRPLLFASKEDILEYVKKEKLHYREDSSNVSEKYDRNLIRLKVIPELKKINPNVEATIEGFIEKMSLTEEIFNDEINRFKKRYLTRHADSFSLDLNGLKEEKGALIKLAEVLKDFNFNYSQSSDLYYSLDGQSGKKIENSTFIALKDRSSILIAPNTIQTTNEYNIEPNTTSLKTNTFTLFFQRVEAKDNRIVASQANACLDYQKLTFPLKLRKWQEGDFFQPLGMKGKKKLSDYFIDRKISAFEKANKHVLLSDNQIIWVVGERIDERYKLTDATPEVLSITLS